jgi:hypothetical protein
VNLMVKKLCQVWAAYRRRRAFTRVRREFAKVGYPLNGLSDSQVEAALTNGEGGITDVVLSAKVIHHTLRRLINLRHQPGVIMAGGVSRMRGPFPAGKRALS